jgi:predicted DNA-binding protein
LQLAVVESEQQSKGIRKMNVTIQVPVPPELKQELELLAKSNFQTLAATVRQLIKKGLRCEANQAAAN